ncbi:DNA replication licensing factor MCM7 [Aphelenchoides besseyi]|nr:DNA replication licensing factor MCM7 [Aphelenchoides besseyi]KAI6232347.1 DNA replication licensing factor MCM7 [Aphelenchoides besseyi]
MSSIKDYDDAKTRLSNFVRSFYVTSDQGVKVYVYSDQVAAISRRRQIAIYVKMDDIHQFDEELHEVIDSNTLRYQKIISEVIDEYARELLGDDIPPVLDARDAFIFQRLYMDQQEKENQADGRTPNDPRQNYPPELMRRFEVYFVKDSLSKPLCVREIRAEHVGRLVSLRGVVIRATDVKPSVNVVTYSCDTCGSETYQSISGRYFQPAVNCPSKECVESRANGRLQTQLRASKLPKFQEIRIQELSDQVPTGSIPRAVNIYLRGENTRKAQPGDDVILSGVLTPSLNTGFKQASGGLITNVFIETHHVLNHRNESEELDEHKLDEDEMKILSQDNIYEILARSIAPEVYGMDDIKKSLLLSLIGGVDASETGMKIRGAINVLLVGDPGVAKSQLLSYVDRLALRSQYTTGRGSSGVGLTAAVVKDSITGEMTLEGGALVLADGGICCIDEFDKMMDTDRTAIHEVMEQQTISIAKAGILTSLNARVAIVAAANPAYGRYNPKKSISENIQLPAALISRFDLLFLICDIPDAETDARLSQHVTYVHREGAHPKLEVEVLPMELVRKYITLCKQKQPKVDVKLMDRLIDKYVEMRQESQENVNSTYTSPRILLGVIRLATALARVNLCDEVTSEHLDEAIRLMDVSKSSLNPTGKTRRKSPKDDAFDAMRGFLLDNENRSCMRDELIRACTSRGIKVDVAEQVLEEKKGEGILIEDAQNRITYPSF